MDFLVDCICGNGMGTLSSYVKASDREHAKRVVANALSKEGHTVLQAISYDMDEIPSDCPYFGPQGELMPSVADQIRKYMVTGVRVFQRLDFEPCTCGSTYLVLEDPTSTDGICAYCCKPKQSPGSNYLAEVDRESSRRI